MSIIEITITPPRRYRKDKSHVYVQFLSKLDANKYEAESKYDNYSLMPWVDYDVKRSNFKYWRVYNLKWSK